DGLSKPYHHLRTLEEIRGAVILSTCNRVEVVAEVDSYHAGLQAVRGFLSESREVPAEEFDSVLISRYEEEAVRHQFALAAGIAAAWWSGRGRWRISPFGHSWREAQRGSWCSTGRCGTRSVSPRARTARPARCRNCRARWRRPTSWSA